MNRIKAFGAFWYDFVIGDDWRVAAFVVAGLALTAICAHAVGVNTWWLLPLFVFAALAWSLHRATKSSKPLSRTVPVFPRNPTLPNYPPRTRPGQPRHGKRAPHRGTPRRAKPHRRHPLPPGAIVQTARKKTRPPWRVFFRLNRDARNARRV